MLDFFINNHLLTIMLVVALGAIAGRVQIGPLRFGAAGALFVGLVFGAIDPRLGQGIGLIKTLGVVLFCYAVGLSAGNTFRSDLRRQWQLMVIGVAGLGVMGVVGVGVGHALGLNSAHAAGLYAGVLTSPAIDAAMKATGGSSDTLVGYAVAYPVGVVVSLLIVGLFVARPWPGKRDVPSIAEAGLCAQTVQIERPAVVERVPGFKDGKVRMSYLLHDDEVGICSPQTRLVPGDRALLVGTPEDVGVAVAYLGRCVEDRRSLTNSRHAVDFRRYILSNPRLAGRKLGVVREEVRNNLGGVVTRVQRTDMDMLGTDDIVLQTGDRMLVVLPREMLGKASDFFGDSEQSVNSLDALSLGLGISLGLLLGTVNVPLPGGLSFSLGAAAGPLVVGMVLGATHRLGKLHWDLPYSISSTLKQTGILLFLASLGLASGRAFFAQGFSLLGVKVGATSAIALLFGAAIMIAGGHLVGMSAPRTTGAFAGFVGQPALLQYATSLVNDERIESAYGALFALGTIAKILIVQVF